MSPLKTAVVNQCISSLVNIILYLSFAFDLPNRFSCNYNLGSVSQVEMSSFLIGQTLRRVSCKEDLDNLLFRNVLK